MKKILNVSLFLLVFGLFVSSGCQSLQSFLPWAKQAEPEPQQPEKFFWDSKHEPIAIAPITTAPAPVGKPFFTEPELVAFTENGTSVVSKTYPWPECGIVQLDKTMPKEAELNRPFDYFIKVTNLTDTMLTDIVITEELSDNFEYTSANPVPKEDIDKLVWEIKSLRPKATRHMTVSGVATRIDPLKNSTIVVTPIVSASAPIRIVQPKLELTRTSPTEALLCEPIPVVFVVTNTGTGSARNVKIVDTLPTGLRTIDGKSKLVFDVGTLTEGQSQQFSAELRANKTGKYFSKAVASSTSAPTAESEETMTTVGLPVLAIMNNGPERQYIGRTLTYEITVTNKSNVPAKNTVIEDNIPEGSTSIEASQGAKLSGLKLVWELGTLEPGTSKKVHVSYTPNKAGTLTNGAIATAYCSEPVIAAVKTIVTGIPAVSMEVVDVHDPVKIGDRTTYVISVTNQGSAIATNISITCILEDNVRYISSAGATAGSIKDQIVKFSPLSSLAPKDKAAWRVVVGAVRPGDVRFKAIMNVDQLTRPVEEAEATHLYE
jgi:uncharacterized repeat protein (TIGR01451 family)